MSWHMPSRSNKLLFWSLIALAVAMVVAVALALRGFNREAGFSNENISAPTPSSSTPLPPASEEVDDVASEPKQLGGFVSEVINGNDAEGKWIELSVSVPENMPTDMPDPGAEPKPITVAMKTTAYKFYLSKDTEGASEIKGGEQVTLSFFGEPSEREYVGVVSNIVVVQK